MPGLSLVGLTGQLAQIPLLKLADNGGATGTLKTVTDGFGNDTALQLSSLAVGIAGALSVAGQIVSSLAVGNAIAIASTQAPTTLVGAVTIGNGVAATSIGMGAGQGWFGTGIVLGTSPSALSGFLTVGAPGSSNQITGYAGSTQIWGMGRDVNGVLIDSFDTFRVIVGSGGTARSGTSVATFSTAGLACTGFGCNGKTPQTPVASGGVLASVVAALIANGILSS